MLRKFIGMQTLLQLNNNYKFKEAKKKLNPIQINKKLKVHIKMLLIHVKVNFKE
jgi:hypothetical protein